MSAEESIFSRWARRAVRAVTTVRRAFAEFLTIPTLVIVGFLLLAILTTALDRHRPSEAATLFRDTQAARDFLSVIAGSLITVTSITLSLLLLAVQQGAASLTSVVFDQFLRRWINQLYFGFFIGLALFALVILATITPGLQPTYGIGVAGGLTVIALYMLILLIYTTIDQMRPVVIIAAIHDLALLARKKQRRLLEGTSRRPRAVAGPARTVFAVEDGYFVGLDVKRLRGGAWGDIAEVILLPAIGDKIAYGQAIVEIRGGSLDSGLALEKAVHGAVKLEGERALKDDPSYGIKQLELLGWVSTSTAQSNPLPGFLACQALRDLGMRWTESDQAFGGGQVEASASEPRIVYRDRLPEHFLDALGSLAVVASESMQHQTIAEAYRTLADLVGRLAPEPRARAETIVLRTLSALGDHVLTLDLEAALIALEEALTAAGADDTAKALSVARDQLSRGVGRLNSRATRVDQASAA